MKNPTRLKIISCNGQSLGFIVSDIIPVDNQGNLFEKIPDEPYEQIGRSLNFKVNIKESKDLPDNFCKDVVVEYSSFFDSVVNRTKLIKGKNKNPVFDESFEHRIEYLTKDEIDLMLKDNVIKNLSRFAFGSSLWKRSLFKIN